MCGWPQLYSISSFRWYRSKLVGASCPRIAPLGTRSNPNGLMCVCVLGVFMYVHIHMLKIFMHVCCI